jgi:hypothetical protein
LAGGFDAAGYLSLTNLKLTIMEEELQELTEVFETSAEKITFEQFKVSSGRVMFIKTQYIKQYKKTSYSYGFVMCASPGGVDYKFLCEWRRTKPSKKHLIETY